MKPILQRHASQRLFESKKGTKAWFFWRGLILGLEAGEEKGKRRENKLVTPDWADSVARQ